MIVSQVLLTTIEEVLTNGFSTWIRLAIYHFCTMKQIGQ